MKRWLGYGVVMVMVLALAAPALAAQAKDRKNKPARGIVAALKYPGISVSPGEKVRVDLVVKNLGRSNETLIFKVKKAPPDWQAYFRSFGNTITGIFVPEDEEYTIDFVAEAKDKEKIKPGIYKFVVLAQTRDGQIKHTSNLNVEVVAKEKAGKDIELNTSYPVLRGPSDAKFEFSLDVKNNSGKDRIFNLSAQAPPDWDVSFKPGYEQKQISSLQIKADQSSSVGVVITPPRNAKVGRYPIKVQVKTPTASADTELSVVLTGTYKIKAVTPTGLLSLTTQTGEPATVSFYVRNEGSAPQPQVSFMSFKPENWKVEFKPEKLQNLKPGEFKQVEATITPAAQALVGDYSVALGAQGEKADSNIELRVTVKASSAWGWIGVAIIILVLGGLAFTFRKLGRR
ncbi:MAG: NEW3 domain-containing protein [Desulfarculaceae bacterium]|jgi:uncharacterized membrane protein